MIRNDHSPESSGRAPEALRKIASGPITEQALTVLLAEVVMKWITSPGRFMLGKRRWMPSWRFRPCENLADAFRLLAAAAPTAYTLLVDEAGCCWVKIQIAGVVGEGHDKSMPRAITYAVARAVGIGVDELG